MATRSLILKLGHVRENAPLLNGLGRFIPQLQRITIKFCKESPSSYGVRQVIEQDIVKFAEQNPHVAIYLKPRRNRSPVFVAEYLNGVRHWQSLFNFDRERVVGWLDIYRTSSGKDIQYQQKHHFTDHPTVQGMWNSYVNTDPSVAVTTFPNEDLAGPTKREKTASEQLIDLYQFQQQQELQSQDKSSPNLTQLEQEQLDSKKQC